MEQTKTTYIKKLEDVDVFIQENFMAFLYITQPTCNVCKSLFPKVETMLESYPQVALARIEMEGMPALAGKLSIFTVPVLLFFIDGKEIIRKARHVSLDELEEQISKYYELAAN